MNTGTVPQTTVRLLDYALGARNNGTVAANTTASNLIQLTNPLSQTFWFDRVAVRYTLNLQTCLIGLYTTEGNRNLLGGDVQFCAVGSPNTLAPNFPWWQLKNAQPLASGQSVYVTVTTFATGLSANDLSVTLIGQYKG